MHDITHSAMLSSLGLLACGIKRQLALLDLARGTVLVKVLADGEIRQLVSDDVSGGGAVPVVAAACGNDGLQVWHAPTGELLSKRMVHEHEIGRAHV